MVAYLELRDADPEALTGAGQAYDLLAGRLAQAASILRLGVLAKLNGTWAGAGHDQAIAGLSQRAANLTAAADELAIAAATLQALGTAAAAAKARLLAALATAQQAGLSVDDSGVAHTPQTPYLPGPLQGVASGIDPQAKTAEEVTHQIAEAVLEATAADEQAARALHRVAAAADLFCQGRLGSQQVQPDRREGASAVTRLVGITTLALSRATDAAIGGAEGIDKAHGVLSEQAAALHGEAQALEAEASQLGERLALLEHNRGLATIAQALTGTPVTQAWAASEATLSDRLLQATQAAGKKQAATAATEGAANLAQRWANNTEWLRTSLKAGAKLPVVGLAAGAGVFTADITIGHEAVGEAGLTTGLSMAGSGFGAELGAFAGGLAGSVVPGVGTVIGAAVGGAAGAAVVGWIGEKGGQLIWDHRAGLEHAASSVAHGVEDAGKWLWHHSPFG
jgi:hypothetical protein